MLQGDADGRDDTAPTRTAARLWTFGGVLVLAATGVQPGTFGQPQVLLVLGAVALVTGLAHHGLVRIGGGSPGLLLATTSLGTVVITVGAVAGGAADVPLASLYGFVALQGALHHGPRGQAALLGGIVVGACVLVWSGTPAGPLLVVLGVSVSGALVAGRQHAAVEAANGRIAAQERWRSGLQSALAHDVRSPLATIDGTLQLLQECGEQVDAATRERLLAAARRQTARVQRLSSDLLDVERVRDGELQLHRSEVAAEQLLGDVAAFAPSAEVANVDPGLVLDVDRLRLEQVLHNLVSNAEKYGAPPVVLDAAGRRDGGVVLGVRDHGPGIPPAVEEQLFGRFEGDTQGVGLGLWIVRRLVEAHGGEVVIVPVHLGARFEVRLPAGAVAGPATRDGGAST